jgi:hypothetical protein
MLSRRQMIAFAAAFGLAASGVAYAQTAIPQHRAPATAAAAHRGSHGDAAIPTLPGQDAFGAVPEIVAILEADPHTDWSKVDLEALRQHLIDMNEVTLKAAAAAKPIGGGLEVAVSGEGRTLVAIQRMVPAWAQAMNGHQGWRTGTTALPGGELLTVTASDPKEVAHIRGLGFIGLLASGSHHQPHHLAIARGDMPYTH